MTRLSPTLVMAGLAPAIPIRKSAAAAKAGERCASPIGITGTRPVMTGRVSFIAGAKRRGRKRALYPAPDPLPSLRSPEPSGFMMPMAKPPECCFVKAM